MQRFFFHLFDDATCLDAEGQELASLQDASQSARRYARDMACAEVKQGRLNLSHRLEVTSAAGEVLETVRFGDVIHIIT